jgi:hypothetical protein
VYIILISSIAEQRHFYVAAPATVSDILFIYAKIAWGPKHSAGESVLTHLTIHQVRVDKLT